MPTDAASQALIILRDGSQFQWLIFLFGYLHFFLVSFWVHDMESVRKKAITVGAIFGVDLVCILVFGLILEWI